LNLIDSHGFSLSGSGLYSFSIKQIMQADVIQKVTINTKIPLAGDCIDASMLYWISLIAFSNSCWNLAIARS